MAFLPLRIEPGYSQYSKTSMMQFIFSLLSINSLYMFRALVAYPQEA
jgi:hypothetical protein